MIKELRIILICHVIALSSANAQYSHFPITHLDWKLIDFEDPSISVVSPAEEMDESSLPVIEDMPQVTLDSCSPFSNHSSWDNNILPLTVGLSSKDSDEPYSGDSFLPTYNQHFSTIVSDDPVFSLSVEILHFLEKMLLCSDDDNISNDLILDYSDLLANRPVHFSYYFNNHTTNKIVARADIFRIAYPFHTELINFTKVPYARPPQEAFINNPSDTIGDLDEKDVYAVNHIAFSKKTASLFNNPSEKNEDEIAKITQLPSDFKRSRRGRADPSWDPGDVATWEINFFDGSANYDAGNQDNTNENIISFTNDLSDNNSTNQFKINFVAPDGVGNLSVFAYGHIGGGAWNDYKEASGFKFMTETGGPGSGDVSSYFDYDTSGIDAWLNGGDPGNSHNDFTWSIYKAGNDYYLSYDFTGDLSLSQAPEPSTYVMTGALLCFIGFNGRSRKASKQLLIALLKKFKFRQSEKNSSQINLIS